MIKGRLQRGEDEILLLGLSRENVNRLLDDQPIHIRGNQLSAMGLPTAMEVLLIGGETEADMSEQLGAMRLQPETAGQELTQRPTMPSTASLNEAQEDGPMTVAAMMSVLSTCDPNALVAIKAGKVFFYSVLALEDAGPVVRLTSSISATVPAEHLQAMIKLLWPDQMTPIAKRQLESLIEQYE